MNPTAILILAVMASQPAAAPGLSWSPAEQEIIDQIRRCNDAWVASLDEKRFDVYETVCPATEQAVFWYTTAEAPRPYKGADGGWARAAAALRRITWRDLEPVAVSVDGDVAYIYYTVTWVPELSTGPEPRVSRRLTVFQRQRGRWFMSGGSIAPADR